MRVDLHTHTYYSADGEGTPADVFALARASSLDVIAVSDHNSCAHIDECVRLADATEGLQFVPAVEFSCSTPYTAGQEIHLLCYFVDRCAEPWESAELQRAIDLRAEVQLENLKRISRELGITATDLDEIVRWCWASGHIHPSVPPSYYFLKRRYRAMNGEKGDSAKTALSVARARLRDRGRWVAYPPFHDLRDAMGRADCRWFLAHPDRYQWADALLERVVGELVSIGLAGIEVNHLESMHAEARYARLVDRHDLFRSAGTDLHGFGGLTAAGYGHLADIIALPETALDWLELKRGQTGASR